MDEQTKEIRFYFSEASANELESIAKQFAGVELVKRRMVWNAVGPAIPPTAYFLSGPIRALEAIIVAYVKHKKKELTLYTDANKQIVSLKATNYSAKDIQEFIKQAASIVEKK
jgi:hypothetical protein